MVLTQPRDWGFLVFTSSSSSSSVSLLTRERRREEKEKQKTIDVRMFQPRCSPKREKKKKKICRDILVPNFMNGILFGGETWALMIITSLPAEFSKFQKE